MKQFSKLFFAAAVAALGLASCAKEVAPVETPNDNLVTVHFGATAGIEGATKATLTPNEQETLFTSAWVNGDVLGVQYYNDGMAEAQVVHATWNETSYSFSTALPEFTGRWIYRAAYPAPEADGSVEFGSSRTQKGNAYNSKYDLMRGSVMTEAPAGKTDDGKDIIFDMTRETAIAYFHFTSKLAEKVVSAKLSVTGGSIANSSVTTDYNNHFVFSDDKPLNEITITFEEGTAPDATDFKLWYNVLQTSYSSMTLEVETTDHKMTISRNSDGAYYSGKLYKVVKNIDDKWVAKGGETPTESSYTIEFYSDAKNETGITNTTKASTIVSKGSEYLTDQPFTSSTKSYYGGINKVLRVGTSSANGSITMDLSELGKCAATKKIILSAKQYSTGKSKTIGVGNSPKQQPGDDYTDLEFTLDGSPLTSIKLNSDGYIYVRSITVVKGIDKRHNINVTEVEGGTLSASAIKAEEGTEITLTAEPLLGYEFNNDWSVTATDGTVINVVDNKFTMPAQDVTVSGTFSKVAYTITKAAAENGSFIVKNGDAEVTTAFKGDKITLEATPAEGFTFDKWTVTYMDGETEKSFTPSANTFNMPAANVTVSATFVETAHVPVYASVADLIAAGAPTTDGSKVTVTLTDEEITKFYKSGKYTNGVYFMVGRQEVQIYCWNTPEEWEVGGTISGTLTNCVWKLYKSTWELCPADYSELTYKAPLPTCATPVITIAEGGVVSIACETAGATIHYTVGDSPDDPTETDAVFSAVTLTDGQTIKAIAFAEGYKPSAVASKKYTVGGAAAEKSETITLSNGVFTDGEKPTITWSGTSCSFVQTQGESTSKVANYTAAPRWYKSHVISFKANAGYKITKVVVTCLSDKDKNGNYKYVKPLTDSAYSPTGTTATASGTEVTITTAGDFTITMGAQSRISSVVVYYTD